MKSLLLLSFSIFTPFTLFAQDYYPLKSKDIYHYSTLDKKEGFTLKIDSVKTEGSDSVYYLMKQLRNKNLTNCNYTAIGDSWLGDSVRIKTDGSCTFVNKLKQPFLIKTKARLNEKWIAFTHSDWKAEISVSGLSEETTLLGSDSVKTFTVNVLSLSGDDITHKYDGLVLNLSKTSGFVRTINLYNFGTDESDFREAGVKSLFLAGKENLLNGLRNFTARDIYNFEPGEVFHKEQSTSNFSDFTHVKILDTILEKSQDALGYTYKIRRKMETNNNNTFSTSVQTLEQTYIFNQFQQIPKTVSSTEDLSIFVYSEGFKKWGKETGFDLRKGESDCVNEMVDGGWCHRIYYEGLGGFYYDCQNMFGVGRSAASLVYYKKLNEEWGKPLMLGIESDPSNDEVSLSPNPANDYLQVQVSGNLYNVILYLKDVSGTNVLTNEIFFKKSSIDISSLKSGLYFYSLFVSDKILKTGKIVIE